MKAIVIIKIMQNLLKRNIYTSDETESEEEPVEKDFIPRIEKDKLDSNKKVELQELERTDRSAELKKYTARDGTMWQPVASQRHKTWEHNIVPSRAGLKNLPAIFTEVY